MRTETTTQHPDAAATGGGGAAAPAVTHKTVADILGEIVWLMSRSPGYRTMAIAELQ